MAKIIEFTAGALADFQESFNWYAERSERAAEGFVDAIEEAFDKILADPERFSFDCQTVPILQRETVSFSYCF